MTEFESQVLIFAPFGKDGALIEKILQSSGVAARVLSEPSALAEAIQKGAGAAIVTEEALSVEAIDLLARSIATQPAWSDFPMLVLTGGGSSTPMTENAVRSRAPLGNITLLERPLRPATLISAVRTALRARKRQYEIRDHLRERQAAEEALRRAHDELESLVEQRTAALRRLSSRLLRVQDEEWRRIARELHDSLGQYLTATKINLDLLAQSDHLSERLKEAQELLERAISDTRTLSHLLHPPLLDEAGLASAATWYIEGFGQRSGMRVSLEMPPDLQRLPVPVETALFRILQEALTNVHRHARSSAVDIRLWMEDSSVRLTIRDYGKGIPQNVLERFQMNGTNVGVGLAGIRERIKELAGTLRVDSSNSGTLLTISIPITDAELMSPEASRAHAGFSASRSQ
ncbi:MAG TPA: ATP-binding protein [Terriglobales bacterium]|nr:ATP-binding protein [Terriglobales bacterium]